MLVVPSDHHSMVCGVCGDQLWLRTWYRPRFCACQWWSQVLVTSVALKEFKLWKA